MSTGRYVPDPPSEAEVMNAWIGAQADVGPGSYDNDVADFRAFIAGIKADALYDAATDLERNPPSLDIWGKSLPGHREAALRLCDLASELVDKPDQEAAQ